jgi:hypothetical protein
VAFKMQSYWALPRSMALLWISNSSIVRCAECAVNWMWLPPR